MPRHLSEEQKGVLIELRTSGNSLREIARELNVSKSTVTNWLRRYWDEGHMQRKAGSGRPPVLSEDEKITLIAASVANPQYTMKQILNTAGVSTSRFTGYRVLSEVGIKSRRPARKFLSSERHEKARLRFCSNFLNVDENFWTTVVFSDEWTISSESARGRFLLDREKNQRFTDTMVRENERYSVSVFAWFSAVTGLSALIRLPKDFKEENYCEILEGEISTMNKLLGDSWVFHQDNSRIHGSRTVNRWLQEKGVRLHPHPPKSSDFKPIEYIWSMLEKEINQSSIINDDSLFEEISRVWKEFDSPDFWLKVANSMSRSLHEGVENNGSTTKC